MEEEKNEGVREIEELKHWKQVYEAGHGLQELARNQKALKDENRRRTVEKEQLLGKVRGVVSLHFIRRCCSSGLSRWVR